MTTPPTQKQQLDAAWDRLKAFINHDVPRLTGRLVVVRSKL